MTAPDTTERDTSRARGWRLAYWLAIAVVVGLVVYWLTRGEGAAPPAPAP